MIDSRLRHSKDQLKGLGITLFQSDVFRDGGVSYAKRKRYLFFRDAMLGLCDAGDGSRAGLCPGGKENTEY